MDNLPQSQENSEKKTQITKIHKSIAIVFERLRAEPYPIDGMIKDIHSEFKNIEEKDIIQALRNGSLGHYGQTYKLNTQVVCTWIRKYQQDKFFPLG